MKGTVKRMKRQPTDWEEAGHRKLCSKDIVGKEPCPKYTKSCENSKKNNEIKKKVSNALVNISPKGKYAHKEIMYIIYSHVHAN